MPNRQQAPEIKDPSYFPFPDYQQTTLSNGIPLYIMPIEGIEFCEIQFAMRAGRAYENKKLLSGYVCREIKEGCKSKNSNEIAETLDYYGAVVKNSEGAAYARISLSTLAKHCGTLLPLVQDMLFTPTFPQQKLDIAEEILYRNFQHTNQEVMYLASKGYDKLMYGNKHPYYLHREEEDFGKIKREDLIEFHKQYYKPDNLMIFAVGKINNEVLKAIEENFGKLTYNADNATPAVSLKFEVNKDQKECYTEKKDCLQSGIVMGMPIMTEDDEDYYKFKVTNTLFGGYFGSRLMSNIREEKGYTYGINSYITNYAENGVLEISTQTGVEYTNKVIEEVKKEMVKLQNDLASEKEISLVKNYLTGSYLSNMSRGLELSMLFSAKILRHIDCKTSYKKEWDAIHNITAEDIRNMAQKYLKTEDLYISIAGKK